MHDARTRRSQQLRLSPGVLGPYRIGIIAWACAAAVLFGSLPAFEIRSILAQVVATTLPALMVLLVSVYLTRGNSHADLAGARTNSGQAFLWLASCVPIVIAVGYFRTDVPLIPQSGFIPLSPIIRFLNTGLHLPHLTAGSEILYCGLFLSGLPIVSLVLLGATRSDFGLGDWNARVTYAVASSMIVGAIAIALMIGRYTLSATVMIAGGVLIANVISDELLCRGIFFGSLMKTLPVHWSLLIQGLVACLLRWHAIPIADQGGVLTSIAAAIVVFLPLSFVLGVLVVSTKSTVSSIGAHWCSVLTSLALVPLLA